MLKKLKTIDWYFAAASAGGKSAHKLLFINSHFRRHRKFSKYPDKREGHQACIRHNQAFYKSSTVGVLNTLFYGSIKIKVLQEKNVLGRILLWF